MPYLPTDTPSVRPDFTCDEFAKKFNLSPATVRSKVCRGQIPSYKIGGSRRIPADYVDAITGTDRSLDTAVENIVAGWPKLTDKQLNTIAGLLRAGKRSA